MILVANYSVWPILKQEPYLFPGARWVQAMRRAGAEVLAPSALTKHPELKRLPLLPVYVKMVADQCCQLRKVPRGKTPGSNGWMRTTEYSVRKFDEWFFWHFRWHEECHKC
eukprot:12080721-Karenia_brevis.AAC.1